jgi:hypothetical protein
VNDILVVVFATLSACFFTSYLFMLSKSIKLKKDLKKVFIEKSLLQEYVDTVKSLKEKETSDDLVHKENFIKFLSDSRDWAFGYIEDVQKGLNKFVNDVDSDISYFEKYGEVGSAYPHYDSMKRISAAYEELKSLLPEKENNG